MAVDKNLFLYDLAVVAVMKNEAPPHHHTNVKEWIDYHLLAGVEHFYIYDNDSSDNLREVLQPYIDAGAVTYKIYPIDNTQIDVYTEAYKTYRFFCRYMAFIDVDEFIFLRSNKNIVAIVDKIFKDTPNFGGLTLNKTDMDKNPSDNFKKISNPRRINGFVLNYGVFYFDEFQNIYDKTFDEKIFINRYSCAPNESDNYVLDEDVLKYRDARQKLIGHYKFKKINTKKLIDALLKNISPVLNEKLTPTFFEGKMENFLTCRALASYFKENALDKERGEFIEKVSLAAVYSSLLANISIGDSELLLSELPNIVQLNYPIVENINSACIQIITQLNNL